MRANKRLGQHFLTSQAIVKKIVSFGNLSKKDVVLEIGPGRGVLTKALLETSGRVIAFEKDRRFFDLLEEKFASEIKDKKLILLRRDILDINSEDYLLLASSYKLISNIPYYITGEILRVFLSSEKKPSVAVLMLQNEVAKRIMARDNKESILSISVKVYGKPEYVSKVPARYFSPKPKVDSAILKISDISGGLFKNKNEEATFFKILRAGFSKKRKKLSSNLSDFFTKEEVFEFFKKCGVSDNARAENLTLNQWFCLFLNRRQ